MKKIIVVMWVFIFLIGGSSMAEYAAKHNVEIGDYSKMLNMDAVGLVNSDAIPNADIAVGVARSIALGIDENIELSDSFVYFDNVTETWIVCLDDEPDAIGGELYIALRKTDGCVVKMWFEE